MTYVDIMLLCLNAQSVMLCAQLLPLRCTDKVAAEESMAYCCVRDQPGKSYPTNAICSLAKVPIGRLLCTD